MNKILTSYIFLLSIACKEAPVTESKYDSIAKHEVERAMPETFFTYKPLKTEVDSGINNPTINFVGYRIRHTFRIKNNSGQEVEKKINILMTSSDSLFNAGLE
jgi:hypothetical protein